MNTASTIKANMSFYLAQTQILRNDIGRQDYKLEKRIEDLDNYRKFNGEAQRTIFPDGLGRSGFMKRITTSDYQVSQIHAIHQADEVTTKWKRGDKYEPSSGSGTNVPIINKTVRAIEDGIFVGCMTSSIKKTQAELILGQLEGIKPFEVKTRKNSFSYGGFERTAEEKEQFRKVYPWVENPENDVIEVSGRNEVIGDFDESTQLSPGANGYEWGTRFVDDVSIISYNEWIKSKKQKDLKNELREWAFKYAEDIRLSYPHITCQLDSLGCMVEDISREEVEQVIISAVGERTAIEGKSFKMRSGQAGFNQPKKIAIQIDSINKPRHKAEVEAMNEEYRKKNIRGIVISNSLKTESKENAEWFEAQKIPFYLFTQNVNCDIAKKNKDMLFELPKPSISYSLRENPPYSIEPLIGLMMYDSVGAALLRIMKRTVSEVHPID